MTPVNSFVLGSMTAASSGGHLTSIDHQAIVTVPSSLPSGGGNSNLTGTHAVRSISAGLQDQQLSIAAMEKAVARASTAATDEDNPTDVSVIIKDYAHVDKGLPIIGRSIYSPQSGERSELERTSERNTIDGRKSRSRRGLTAGGSSTLEHRSKRSSLPADGRLQDGKNLPENSIRLKPQVKIYKLKIFSNIKDYDVCTKKSGYPFDKFCFTLQGTILQVHVRVSYNFI